MSEEILANTHAGSAEKSATRIELTKEGVLIDLYQMSANEDMKKARRASTSANSKEAKRVWKESDSCMAPYSDGRWYHAKIIKLNNQKCRVCYTEYDEEGDVEVSQLLSESDVEHPEEEEQMDTVVYDKQFKAPGAKSNGRFAVPAMCPPPPELFEKLKVTNDKESLTNMLMAWYMSGYHTGFHMGLTQAREK
ncbi:Tudor domain-containing protein [Aphelenchoides bicaudatus]|nr:Tudor domain-containing protein [Aphelenchoides bicaudatus]